MKSFACGEMKTFYGNLGLLQVSNLKLIIYLLAYVAFLRIC